MSFEDVFSEARERFAEVLQLLNTLEAAYDGSSQSAPTGPVKALRGLFLVALYGAFERSINAAVEQAILVISSHVSPSNSCNPAIFTVFHHSHIQSVRGCSYERVFDKSLALFTELASGASISIANNPLAEILQNVDGSTLKKISIYFGLTEHEISPSSLGRLNNLRERRNAVAHGRESAATAGERFSYAELRTMYSIADEEVTKFIQTLQDHCVNKRYLMRQLEHYFSLRRLKSKA